jgi:hypothetical protein
LNRNSKVVKSVVILLIARIDRVQEGWIQGMLMDSTTVLAVKRLEALFNGQSLICQTSTKDRSKKDCGIVTIHLESFRASIVRVIRAVAKVCKRSVCRRRRITGQSAKSTCCRAASRQDGKRTTGFSWASGSRGPFLHVPGS